MALLRLQVTAANAAPAAQAPGSAQSAPPDGEIEALSAGAQSFIGVIEADGLGLSVGALYAPPSAPQQAAGPSPSDKDPGAKGSPPPGGTLKTAAAETADPAFAFRDLYAFPNPCRGSQRPTIRLQAGLADSVEVRIYDVSGALAHSAVLGEPRIFDDGNGKGAQYTYDYAWDASGTGSGVYIVAATAKKAGQPDIRRTKKLALIK